MRIRTGIAGWGVALVAAVMVLFCGRAEAQRVALVVGIGAYQAVPTLPNPPNDAADIAAALTRLGFDVDLVRDPDRAALEGAVRRLGQRARGAEAAVFFYAGHALQLGERNWLLPTSANIASERDMRFEALELDSVLEQMNAGARLSIVLLDACRDNPFRMRLGPGATRGIATSGLAQVPAAVGTLVAFSTAPGLVAEDGNGRNSPFTAALLRHIEQPGLELRAMMAEVRRDVREATQGRQVPWEQSALEGNFVFRAAAAQPAPPPAQAGNAQAARDADLVFWDSIRNSRNPAELRAYLERFPNGTFADLARGRLAAAEQRAEAARQGGPQTPSARPANAATGAATPASPTAAPPQTAPPPATGPGAPQQASAAVTAPPVAVAAAPPLTAAQFRQAMPYMTAENAERAAQRYGAAAQHRAFAANPDRRNWHFSADYGLALSAEQATLERCQIVHGSPCILIAVDNELRGRIGSTPPRSMPRVTYAGPLVLEQVPVITPAARQVYAMLRDYGAASGPKALAMHPWGRFFPITGAANEREAQTRALEACNSDSTQSGREGPCFVYAVGDTVVLPERRRVAAAPPPPPPQRPGSRPASR